MNATTASTGTHNSTHAAELAALVELEARWENLRTAPSRTAEVRSTNEDLHGMQRAYETFRAKLAAFNARYAPAHVPELLLNSPVRLGVWCRRMRDLYAQVVEDPTVRAPVHLMEKAYRCADKIASRIGKDHPARPTPPDDVRAAVAELEALTRWCDDLVAVEIAANAP